MKEERKNTTENWQNISQNKCYQSACKFIHYFNEQIWDSLIINSNEQIQEYNFAPSTFVTTNSSESCNAMIKRYVQGKKLTVSNLCISLKEMVDGMLEEIKKRNIWNIKKIYLIGYLEKHKIRSN